MKYHNGSTTERHLLTGDFLEHPSQYNSRASNIYTSNGRSPPGSRRPGRGTRAGSRAAGCWRTSLAERGSAAAGTAASRSPPSGSGRSSSAPGCAASRRPVRTLLEAACRSELLLPRPLEMTDNPPVPGKPSPSLQQSGAQGTATLIVMVAVLVIIVLFCCFAAPGIRGLCKRYVFRTCDIDDPDIDNASRITEEASPTVILLPNGRMLVVDRRILMRSAFDLSNVPDLARPFRGSTPSILDSSETSKGVSPTSLGYPPPNYEDVFPRLLDLPPSYSEISLMAKNFEAMEMAALDRSSEAIDSTASVAVGVTASDQSTEAVTVTASEDVGVAASDLRSEAVVLTASGQGSESVGVAAIEMRDLGGRLGAASEDGECAINSNSEQNTVIVVENNQGVFGGESNGDVEVNVDRTNYYNSF